MSFFFSSCLPLILTLFYHISTFFYLILIYFSLIIFHFALFFFISSLRGSISPPPQAGSLFNTARISQDMFRSVSRVKSANLRRNSVDSAPSRKNSAIYPNSRNGSQSNSFTENSISVLSDKHQLLLLESVLHIADVSNPAKPWKLYSRWLDGVMAEFYNQGSEVHAYVHMYTFTCTHICTYTHGGATYMSLH